MKASFKLLSLALTTLLITISAQAAPRQLTLRYFGQQFRGMNTLYLKRKLRQDFPNINIRRAALQRVVIMAKSKHGMGEATLILNNQYFYPEIIPGNPRQFNRNAPRSFARIPLNSQRIMNSQGPWQIDLRGNIRVAKVILFLRTVRPGPGPGPGPMPGRLVTMQDIGSFKASKLIERTKIFHIGAYDVKKIEITAIKKSVEILDVLVTFANGATSSMYQLEGHLNESRTKGLTFPNRNGRDIESISITALSPNPFGSRSRVKLSIGVLR